MDGTQPVMVSSVGLSLPECGERVRVAEQLGYGQVWVDQLPDQRDSGVVAAECLRATSAAQVGTAIMPVHLRHPVAMAQLAATLDELSGGRFILGLGLSHQLVNELMLGRRQGRPIRVMREYVSIVRALLRDGTVNSEGEYFTARVGYAAPRRPATPIYLAGLRPQMIRLAVQLGDGLLLYMCSAEFVRERVMPAVRTASAELDRDPQQFPVLALVQAYAGQHPSRTRAAIREHLASHAMMPYYRRVLEASGFSRGQIGDAALDALAATGTPDQVRARLDAYREAGCMPMPMPFAAERDDFAATLAASLPARS